MTNSNKNRLIPVEARTIFSRFFHVVFSFRNFKIVFVYTSLFVFTTFKASAQGKSDDAHKSAVITTVGGIKYYIHTVGKGQTLFAIAKLYNKTVNDIVIENPTAIDGIKPGQELKIPFEKPVKIVAVTTPIDISNFIQHKVEQGQTLYSLSKQYGVSVEKIKSANPEMKDGLNAGQTINIPSDKPFKKSAATPIKITVPNSEPTIPNLNSVVTEKSKTNDISEKQTTTINYQGELKEEYNIAFFLPFHAEEANALELEKVIKGDLQLPNKTKVALLFYEGACIAIDSLKKLKLNAKIFVYDIDDADSLSISKILKKPELASMDLMIGPLYGASFIAISKFAKENNIAIVSPFTQLNKILFNNPYVCKISPSTTLQVEQMAHFVVDTFQTQNVILVNTLNQKDAPYYTTFKTTANEGLLKVGHPVSDSVKVAFNLAGVQLMLHATKVNVVVLPSNNQSYVSDFVSKLNVLRDKYNIVLFGLQSWNNYDNMDFEYLNNLSLHIPSNTYIDYENNVTKRFVKKYRDDYKTEPELYAFQGFDATFYFVSLLKKYGTSFLKNLPENTYQGIEANFNFLQHPPASGLENKGVFILKYKEYKLVKAN
jgi:LysM repeat protein/ABC-type branched-subunit amino acid transport system substrate-binding protein